MTSYEGQPLPPTALYHRSMLSMAGQSANNLGLFGPPTDRPTQTQYARLSSAALVSPHGTHMVPNTIRQSRYNLRPKGPVADHPTPFARQSGIAQDHSSTQAIQSDSVADYSTPYARQHHTGLPGHLRRTIQVRLGRARCYTKHTVFVPTSVALPS